MPHPKTRYPVPRLRRFRLLADKTQAEVADEVGKSTSFVCHLESGRAAATENVLISLAVSVGVEPEDLFDDNTER